MERVVGIGGLFFRARDPEGLARWYAEVLGVGGGFAPWDQAAGPTVFAPFPEDTDYFGRSSQQWMINFRVDNLDRIIEWLQGQDIAVETRPEWDSEAGRFARIHDPEGNPIELWQPAMPS